MSLGGGEYLALTEELRRKLAEDSYSSSVQLYASDMANASNAVVAMNGDFYAFRDLGITAYQRKLYRNNPAQVDSCFFTASGDMLFTRAGELMGEGEAEAFIEANDVVFWWITGSCSTAPATPSARSTPSTPAPASP